MKKILIGILLLSIFLSGCVQQPVELPETTIQETTIEVSTVKETTTLAECSQDSDCATGGCSGQVCGVKGKVEGIVTTCEWKDEYSCLKKTSCGCVDGSCRWKETREYKDCMAKLRGETK